MHARRGVDGSRRGRSCAGARARRGASRLRRRARARAVHDRGARAARGAGKESRAGRGGARARARWISARCGSRSCGLAARRRSSCGGGCAQLHTPGSSSVRARWRAIARRGRISRWRSPPRTAPPAELIGTITALGMFPRPYEAWLIELVEEARASVGAWPRSAKGVPGAARARAARGATTCRRGRSPRALDPLAPPVVARLARGAGSLAEGVLHAGEFKTLDKDGDPHGDRDCGRASRHRTGLWHTPPHVHGDTCAGAARSSSSSEQGARHRRRLASWRASSSSWPPLRAARSRSRIAIAFLAPAVAIEGVGSSDVSHARGPRRSRGWVCLHRAGCSGIPGSAVLDLGCHAVAVPQDGQHARAGADRAPRRTDAVFGPTRRDELLWLDDRARLRRPATGCATVKLRTSARRHRRSRSTQIARHARLVQLLQPRVRDG